MIRQTFAEYVADEAVNYSSLKYIDDSPLHYLHHLHNERKDTPSLALGRVTHSLVFEPDRIEHEYAVWEEGDRKGNAYKDFVAANEGKTIFKPAEIAGARRMAEAVRASPLVRPYLTDGLFEQTIKWADLLTGLDCKARPDWLTRGVLADLKTTRNADPRRFARDVASYGYHRQLAHYSNGLGWVPEKVILIAVENTEPHDVLVYQLPDDALMVGADCVARWLRQLAWCKAHNRYPGRAAKWLEDEGRYDVPREELLSLPDWILGEQIITEGEE